MLNTLNIGILDSQLEKPISSQRRARKQRIFETALQWTAGGGREQRGVFVHSTVNTAAPGISMVLPSPF